MRGTLGDRVIGVNQWTSPTGQTEGAKARFVRHELTRGPAAIQDLGDANGTMELSFHFDEIFCDPEAEQEYIENAFRARTPLRLFVDQRGFKISSYIIESLETTSLKYAPSGRKVRVDMKASMTEAKGGNTSSAIGLAIGVASALLNPLVRR